MKDFKELSNNLDFLDDDINVDSTSNKKYKIVIADDEKDVHDVTKLILKDMVFEGRNFEFIDTYNGKDTIEYIKNNEDVAILFLDVVMESNHSGLEVVRYIRQELENRLVRIILRTGHPGEAPEQKVIREYDINDYRLKTEMTSNRLQTTVFSAMRNYRDIMILQKHKKNLEKIIKASVKLFEYNSMNDFLVAILNELANMSMEERDLVFIRENHDAKLSGFVATEDQKRNRIVAATGRYEKFISHYIEDVIELKHLSNFMRLGKVSDSFVHIVENGFVIESRGTSKVRNYIFVEGKKEDFDFDIINLFLSNFSIALDNHILNNMITSTQKEIIFALSETIDSHYEETGSHIKRISKMMYQFALANNYSYAECEMTKLACTMHDLGKVAIPDAILKKPAKLTSDEFEVMKTHAAHGYRILSSSELPILKTASEIALYHHEKFDGSGYPKGLKGKDIPLSARMMAIVDVFDALTHKRVYKEACCVEEAVELLENEKGKHFDPALVDLFLNNFSQITNINEDLEQKPE